MFGGSFSILHWIVVLAVVLLLFGGRGKVSAIMGDFGKGLRNFKTGLKGPDGDAGEDDAAEAIEESTRPVKKAPAKKAPAKKAARKKAPAKKKSASKKASAKK
jgi:sec-independent protein translocase protein TatA|tara:strand:+ start:648 stop:956 length:309 start_codon:yes stop_codon:yes gene_type:complete